MTKAPGWGLRGENIRYGPLCNDTHLDRIVNIGEFFLTTRFVDNTVVSWIKRIIRILLPLDLFMNRAIRLWSTYGSNDDELCSNRKCTKGHWLCLNLHDALQEQSMLRNTIRLPRKSQENNSSRSSVKNILRGVI